ncbi:hypothetical protein ACFW9I_37355, partial [[Kitasatospora] papulosa]|uniref:hypothetical protein n=1 Tax=[Kitasatospora] papulosa TaxID=1464011 RepID=UPI0036AF9858
MDGRVGSAAAANAAMACDADAVEDPPIPETDVEGPSETVPGTPAPAAAAFNRRVTQAFLMALLRLSGPIVSLPLLATSLRPSGPNVSLPCLEASLRASGPRL